MAKNVYQPQTATSRPPGTPDNQIPNQICPHIHFRTDVIDREILSRKQHLNLLCTPKGYRWVIKKNKEESDADRMDTTKHVFVCSDKRKKSGKTYVHNFLAEIWSLLTPEMVERLKEMLMNEFGMTAEESVRFICEQRMRTLEFSERHHSANAQEDKEEEEVEEPQDPHLPRVIVGDQRFCDRSEFAVGIDPCRIKEFSRTVSNKLSEYVMAMMCAKRNNRHKRMAEVILNGLCGVTGEKCTLDKPKNRLHKILTLVSDRTALWLADNIKDEDKKRDNERKKEDAEIRKRHIEKMKERERRKEEHEKLAKEREKQEKKRAKQEEEDARKAKEEKERNKAEKDKRHQDFEKTRQKKKDGEDKKSGGKGDGDRKGDTESKGGSKSGAPKDDVSKDGKGKGGDSKGGKRQGGGKSKGQGGKGSGGGSKGGPPKTASGGKRPVKKPGRASGGGSKKTRPTGDGPKDEQGPSADDKPEDEPTESPEQAQKISGETASSGEGKTEQGGVESPAEQPKTEEGEADAAEQAEPKAEETPAEAEIKPAESETKPDEEKPEPGAEEPTPSEEGPKPAEEEPKPGEEEPKPAEEEPKPGEEEPKPGEEEPKPAEEEPKPGEEEPKPAEEEPKPAEEEPKPAEEEPKPAEEEPKPVEEVPPEEKTPEDQKESSAVDRAASPALPLPTQAALESSVSEIIDTKPVATPRQEAIQDIISKELEKRVESKDDETKELIREISAKTASWIDQKVKVVEDEYGNRDKTVQPVTQKPKGPIFSLRKSEDHINVRRATHLEAERGIRETRGKALPVKLDASKPMTPEDAKMWAKWAENATQMAEDWGKWIDKTIQDAEEKTIRYRSSGKDKGKEIDVDKQDWEKFTGKTLEEGLEWRRNRKALEEMAAKWQEKSKKQ